MGEQQDQSQSGQCRICLKTVKHLKMHGNIHSGVGIKKCAICGKFITRHNFKKHLKIHSNNRPIMKCGLCGARFKSKQGLDNHIQYLHNKKQGKLLCLFCPVKLLNKSQLEIHTRKHTLERPYFCGWCKSELATKSSLECHTNRHTKKRSFKCHFCPKLFFCKRGWKRHTQTHTTEKYFKCELCSKTFATRPGLRRHTATHLGTTIKCKVCEKVLTEGSYPQHLKTHTERQRNHKCEKCNASFTSRESLWQHNRFVHNKHISYRTSCVLCPLKFTCFTALEIHTRSHTLERPFFCNQCNGEFTMKKNLQRHQLTCQCNLKSRQF